MVGMDLEQTGTRSRPLSTPASDRGIRQRSASDRGIRQRYVQVRWIRAGWMDGRVLSVVRRAKSATCGQQGIKGAGREWSRSQAGFS
ncbi:unnamed protein product, partial [Staurois parvus]